MEKYFIIDASGFINGFNIVGNLNFTVSEITEEIKDLKSQLLLEESIETDKVSILNPKESFINEINEITSKSGDNLRLSNPDTKLLALALEFKSEGKEVLVVSDDYTIQNTLKILNIKYQPIITEGINRIYNWKKVCTGCKHEYPNDYTQEDCEICGSKIYKKRIKN
ncbi:MAG: ribonuclease VapC [Methanobrevibacter sp.]|jgi:UPF0271 protein|nr:ribonuclease VapC [Methanobrevibacter sp.]